MSFSPKNILNKYGIRPSKRLGQNFLIDKSALNKVIKAAEIKPTDIILEIGPGLGVLTWELAKKAKRIIAVEKDPKMCEILKQVLRDYKNVKIICGDILKLPTTHYPLPTKYKVVANLPYYITSPVIRKFLESKYPTTIMVLMVQKEVAQRICARPPKMNLLAVSVQFYGGPEIISYVSKNSFWPRPKVDSAIIKIIPFKASRCPTPTKLFFRIVKAGFSHPRKQLVNNLLALSLPKGVKLIKSIRQTQDREKIKNWLLKNKINPDQRAESLSIKDWLRLTFAFPQKTC